MKVTQAEAQAVLERVTRRMNEEKELKEQAKRELHPICSDCGEYGHTKGCMTCQYPQN